MERTVSPGAMEAMVSRTAVVDWARELYEDLDFSAVRRWLA